MWPVWAFVTSSLIYSVNCWAAPTEEYNIARETVEEAAVNARRLVTTRAEGIATMCSVFPSNSSDSELAGRPLGPYRLVNSLDARI